MLGIFAMLGFFQHRGRQLFVTAVLTIVCYSVHDMIVVFDRIRENLRLNPGEPLNPVINFSIMQTLARSVITSLTVVLTLLALYSFGGFSYAAAGGSTARNGLAALTVPMRVRRRSSNAAPTFHGAGHSAPRLAAASSERAGRYSPMTETLSEPALAT